MEYRSIAVADLRLDPKNPRLPEHLRDADENEIIRFLLNEEALEELAVSFSENGFFSSDPLIVVARDGALRNVVVEGNRRLATLKIILGYVDAPAGQLFDLDFPAARIAELAQVPCFVADSREDVSRFIGFRHIGGLRLWPPEAKARYVADAVDAAAEQGHADPFREVGRQVGSNAQGVRSLYLAIAILRYARDQFGQNVSELQSNRFGVWLRALGSPELREYIGLPNFRAHREVVGSLHQLDEDRLIEVVRDLTPPQGERRALVNDSRMITDYGRILASAQAREVLRATLNFEAARQLVEELSLSDRLGRVVALVDALLDEVNKTESIEITESVVASASKLATMTRSLNRLLQAALEDQAD